MQTCERAVGHLNFSDTDHFISSLYGQVEIEDDELPSGRHDDAEVTDDATDVSKQIKPATFGKAC